MKIKIRETLNTIVPKYVYTGRKNIFNLNITDKFKYLILPVRITAPFIDRSTRFLLFYDGVTADSATYPFATSLTGLTTEGR
jgi:hypothetical protein